MSLRLNHIRHKKLLKEASEEAENSCSEYYSINYPSLSVYQCIVKLSLLLFLEESQAYYTFMWIRVKTSPLNDFSES